MQSSCSLVYIMETPQICPQMAIVLEKDDVKVTVVNGNVASISKSSGLSTLGKILVFDWKCKSNNWNHKWNIWISGIILITSTFVAAIMAVILFVLKRPERRNRILSFFRNGNATVHYSRVSTHQTVARSQLIHKILRNFITKVQQKWIETNTQKRLKCPSKRKFLFSFLVFFPLLIFSDDLIKRNTFLFKVIASVLYCRLSCCLLPLHFRWHW